MGDGRVRLELLERLQAGVQHLLEQHSVKCEVNGGKGVVVV